MPRLLPFLLLATLAQAAPPPLIDGPFPRGFFFRGSEGMARNPNTEYDQWSAIFSRLGGIMGKVFDEEVPNTARRNIDFFTRFAAQHPDQAVMLHYNGNARDPRNADGVFAGHWLYHDGSLLTADLPADANAVVLHVEDASKYQLKVGRNRDDEKAPVHHEDVMIAPYVDGRIDFHKAEQLELVEVDTKAKTITVKRGAFGTQPRAFKAGQAIVQPHVYEGPWGRFSNLMWHYNWRADCPKDAQGRTAADVFVAEFQSLFGPGGRCAGFDGIEFDVLGWSKASGRGIDSDGDGQTDNGFKDGANVYALGVYQLCERLHAALPDMIWMADGWSTHNQNGVGALNGIESEGWPTLQDHQIVDWSGGLNRHRYNMAFARPPRFSYVNHKTIIDGNQGAQTPLSLARLVQGACLIMDSGFCYSMRPMGAKGAMPVYDELVAGTLQRPGWLGMPEEEPVSLAARTPNLLAGRELAGPAVKVDGAKLTLSTEPGAAVLRVPLADLDLDGMTDLTVQCRLSSEPPAGMPRGVPREVAVVVRAAGDLLTETIRTGIQLASGEDVEIDRGTSGAMARLGDSMAEASRKRAVYVHPPYRGGVKGETWWEVDTTVPPRAKLTFQTVLNHAPNPSDGVRFTVLITPQGGQTTQVFSEQRMTYDWQPASADLAQFAGQRVTVRFSAGPGDAGNTVADQANWAEVSLTTGGRDSLQRGEFSARRIMSWAGPQPFEAGFYFRNVGPGTAELVFEAEGDQPLTIEDLQVHAAPDLWSRRFEHGLVLINPSTTPQTFDMQALGAGGRYRRLQGSEDQDPVINNGQPAGERETVPPRDALFLLRD